MLSNIVRTKWSRMILPFIALLLYSNDAIAEDWSQLVRDTMPSVVSLQGFDAAGQQVSSASGFSIGNNRIVSCFHCIQDQDISRLDAVTKEGERISVTHIIAFSQELDIVILTHDGDSLPPLDFPEERPDPGSPVIVIGCPRAFEFSVTDGVLSGWRINDIEQVRHEVQFTAPVSPGNSGGPVFSQNGNVLGVVSWARIDPGSQNLNFGISYEHIIELIEDSNVESPIAFEDREVSNAISDLNGIHSFYDSIAEEYYYNREYLRLYDLELAEQELHRLRNLERESENRDARRDIQQRQREITQLRQNLRRGIGARQPSIVPTIDDLGAVGELSVGAVSSVFFLQDVITEFDSIVTVRSYGRIVNGRFQEGQWDSAPFIIHGASLHQVVEGEAVDFSGIYISLGVEHVTLESDRVVRMRSFSALDRVQLDEAIERLGRTTRNQLTRLAAQNLRDDLRE